MLEIKTDKDIDTGDAYSETESYESIKRGSENELLFTGLMAASRTPDMNIVNFNDASSDVEIMPGSDHPLHTELTQKQKGHKKKNSKKKSNQRKNQKHLTESIRRISFVSNVSSHATQSYTI